MRYLAFVLTLLAVVPLAGCSLFNKAETNPVLAIILTPIADVGCDVEKEVVSVAASVMNTQCGAPVASAQACINSAIGNANICALPGIPAVTSSQVQSKVASFGGAHVKAVIGNLVCPVAVPFFLGLFTNAIPSSCGCTKSFAAGSFQTTLTAACEAGVPF